METRIEKIEAELCKEEVFTDPKRAMEFSEKLSSTKEELEICYSEWFTIHDLET